MDDDWENVVIETGVDTLLNYLAENGEAPVSTISEDLGVSDKRIKKWAKALEDNGFVERNYSARKGMVLSYTKQNKESADEKLEKVREEVEQETQKVEQELSTRDKDIQKAKKKLEQMSEELEENREEENEVKEKLEELKELEKELEEKLEEQKEKQENLHNNSLQLISRIDNTLNKIDEAEQKADSFEKKEQELKKKVKALKKLEKHTEKVEDLDRELKDLRAEEEESSNIFSSFKEKLDNLFSQESSSASYETILDQPVKDIKKDVRESDSLDPEKLLELEKNGKDRKTLKKFLDRRVENE